MTAARSTEAAMDTTTTAEAAVSRLAPEDFAERAAAIESEVGKVIVGQRELVRQTLTGLLANSHVLLEGVPGLGKTMLVRTIADVIDCTFSRIQFTPDLMPADITGTNILVEEEGRRVFRFQAGPIFANLVLADEINRATPKTQSSLLEAMQEHQVTVARNRYALDPPFFVLATQNPLVSAGKIYALLDGRFNVSIEDIRAVALPALRHRVILNFEGEAEGITPEAIVRSVLDAVAPPSVE